RAYAKYRLAHLVDARGDEDAVRVAHPAHHRGGGEPRRHPERRDTVGRDRRVAEEIDLQRGEACSERLARDPVAPEPVRHALLEDETYGFPKSLGEVSGHRNRLVTAAALWHSAAARSRDPLALPANEIVCVGGR